MSGFVAVFRREMLLMQKKVGKLGYVFSSVLFPVIYLFAFGWGFGSRMDVNGGYVPFLAQGIISLTVMLNAFQQTSLAVSINRLYFGTFQTLILSPVPPWQTAAALVAAGVVRGVLMGGLIYGVAYWVFAVPPLAFTAVVGVILEGIFFGAFGLLIGLLVSDPDEISFVNNFIITPMMYFCGSFFPVTHLPEQWQMLLGILPLSLANSLVRAEGWTMHVISQGLVLFALAIVIYLVGTRKLKHYAE